MIDSEDEGVGQVDLVENLRHTEIDIDLWGNDQPETPPESEQEPETTPKLPTAPTNSFADLTQEELLVLKDNLHLYPKHKQIQILEILDVLAERKKAKRRRENLLDFIRYVDPDYKVGKHHKKLATLLEDMAFGRKDRVMVNIAPRFGKLVADETPVLTPGGWTTHGELKVGDEVFHPSGKPIKVLAVSGKGPANVKMTFGIGLGKESVYCHENHEWGLIHAPSKVYKVRETNEFLGGRALKFLSTGKISKNGVRLQRCSYQLPDVSPLQYPEKQLPLHPYVLGVWLGDGSTGKVCVTHHVDDTDHLEKIRTLGYEISSVWNQVSPTTKTSSFGGKRGVPSPLRKALLACGVFTKKRIPDEFKYSSVEQRLELLAGLLDTDGYTDQNGRVLITTVCPELAADIEDVAMSLGWRPYRTVVPPALSSSGIQGRRDTIVVGFNPTLPLPVALQRKQNKRLGVRRKVGLWAVERTSETKIGNCIQVDSPDGLYLVGKTLIPTHNSQLTSIYFPAWFVGNFPHKNIIMVSHTSDLAVEFGRKVRNIVDSEAYRDTFPGVALAADSKAAGRWATNSGGSYYACGIGGALAGRGSDLLCISGSSIIITKERGKVQADTVKIGEHVWGFNKFNKVEKIFHSQSVEEVEIDGAVMTPNHPVWTFDRGWVRAGNLTTHQIVDTISLWSYIRLYGEIWYGQAQNTWGKLFKGIQHLGDDAAEMHQRESRQLYPVRWARNKMLRALGKVRELPGRHGVASVPQSNTGSYRQRWGLYQGELSLDRPGNTSLQSAQWYQNNCLWTDPISVSMGKENRAKSGRDTSSDFCNGYGPGRSHEVPENELGAAPRVADEFGWYKSSAVQLISGCREADWPYKRLLMGCVEKAIASKIFGLLVGVRRLKKVEHRCGSSKAYLNFQVSDSNTFCVNGLTTHNCIDDPHNEQEVLSGNYEVFERAYDWYAYGARTRLSPTGVVAIVATRWAENDLTGKLIQDMTRNPGSDQWEVVEFPAILDVEEEVKDENGISNGYTRIVQKSLWPEQWTLESLLRTKASMPPFQWSAQYMQQPTSKDSAIVKREWWQKWEAEEPPACEYVIMSLDAAAEKNNRSDYTSLSTWGVFYKENDEGIMVANIILLNAIKARWEFPELKRRAYKEYREWNPDWFLVEKKSAGVALYQEMRAAGIPVQEVTPTRYSGDKVARLNSVCDIFSSGLVWYPAGRRWAEDLVDEVCGFPAMPQDDQVDTCVYSLMRFRSGGFITLPTDRYDEDEPEFRPRRPAYY